MKYSIYDLRKDEGGYAIVNEQTREIIIETKDESTLWRVLKELNNQDKMIKSLKDLITSNCVGEEETLDGYEKVYTITDSELQDCLKEFSR